MLLYVSIIAIILLSALVVIFFRRFTVIKINGRSMYPTLKPGQLRLMDRKFNSADIPHFDDLDYMENRIFVMWSPTGLPIIKRLTRIDQFINHREYFVEGDNPDESLDSRQHGTLRKEGFIGELVGLREAPKRLFYNPVRERRKWRKKSRQSV